MRTLRPGACVRFADPDKTGLEAQVFWRKEDYRRVVSAYARSRLDRGFGTLVRLGDIRCQKTLLKTVCGDQQLLLQNAQNVAQLRCVGEDIRLEPFALEIVVEEFPHVEASQRSIRGLADICRNRRLGGSKKEWTVEAMRHRDALIAVDLGCQNYRYRDVARFLHGERMVEEEWNNPNRTLKNRTIRSFKRGIRLVDGGYRSLLG